MKNKKNGLITVCMIVTVISILLSGCGNGKSANTTATTGVFYTGEEREELIYGEYCINMTKMIYQHQDYANFLKGVNMMEVDNVNISAVPFQINAGKFGYKDENAEIFSYFNFPDNESLDEKRSELVSKYGEDGVRYFNNYMKMLAAPYIIVKYVVEPDASQNEYQIATVQGFYKVNDNKVTIYGKDPDPDTYELNYEEPYITFEYSFNKNGSMIVSNNDSTVVLLSYERTDYRQGHPMNVSINGYIADGEEPLNDIVHISFIEGVSFAKTIFFEDGRNAYGTEMKFNKDGTFSIKWDGKGNNPFDVDEEPGEIKGHYLYCYGSGAILTVDGKTYYYIDSEQDYFGSTFDYIDTETVQPSDVAVIAGVQKNITDDIREAFDKAGINVIIDEKTGEVTTDDSILFGVDESDVSDTGKEYLDKFLEVYSEVILPYVGDGYIAEITVEGHTDTSGTYDYNLELSKKRAEAVAAYCVEQQPLLKEAITAKGFSFEKPVLDSDGNIDMDASRRVVFAFKMGTGEKEVNQ